MWVGTSVRQLPWTGELGSQTVTDLITKRHMTELSTTALFFLSYYYFFSHYPTFFIHYHTIDPLYPFHPPPAPSPLVTTKSVLCVNVLVFVWFGLFIHFVLFVYFLYSTYE